MKRILIIIICFFPMMSTVSNKCLVYQQSVSTPSIIRRPYLLNGDDVWNRLNREVKTDRSSFYKLIPWFIFTFFVLVLVLILFIVFIKNNR